MHKGSNIVVNNPKKSVDKCGKLFLANVNKVKQKWSNNKKLTPKKTFPHTFTLKITSY